MKADATLDKKTPTRESSDEKLNEFSGTGVFGSALLEIGWQLALGIVAPLWIISIYKSTWLDSSWFALFVVWIIVVFSSVVFKQLKKIPRKYGGLE